MKLRRRGGAHGGAAARERCPGRSVGPVDPGAPSAPTTIPDSTVATARGGGASTATPFASRQTPGAYQSLPSAPRTNTHGENAVPAGAVTHRPGIHAQRSRLHVHSPSTHTVLVCGLGGTTSTRAGGGGTATSTSASKGCGAYVACGTRVAQATASAQMAATTKRMIGSGAPSIPCPPARSAAAVLRATFAAFAATAVMACASIPEGRSAVDSVRLVGGRSIDRDDVTDRLATTASPKFFGLFRGVVYDYSVFDASVLQRDLARVERYYRGRGFFEAHARAARVIQKSADHVRVEIVVDEGPATSNRLVRIVGLDGVPAPIAAEARIAVDGAMPEGARFDEDTYARAKTVLVSALTQRGYAYASVQDDAQVDLTTHAVDYTFTVHPGSAAVFGPITFVGLDPSLKISEAQLRRTMHLREGKPYSSALLDSATQALFDLEVFSMVQVVPALPDPPAQVVPITVTLEPTKLRLVRLGGGAEFDEIKTDVHGLVGWEDHDFLGGLRDFTIDFKPGVVLYPIRLDNMVAPDQLLPEERLRLQLRQPGFLEPRTTLFVRPEGNVYPLLVETSPDPKANVVGYVEPKGAVGVDRRFGRHFFATFGYNAQGEIPFSYRGPPDASLPDIVLSFPQLITKVDFRDDPVHPHAGVYVGNDLQVAGGPFGGNATDVRVQSEVRGFVPLARGVTLAARGALGFLFALNYGDRVKANDLASNDVATNRDIELVYFRGMFSGGPSSNRGFPLRGIAPHGVVPFLDPATATAQVALSCDPKSPSYKPGPLCSIPIGGFTLWEASLEVRFDVSGPLGVAVFCDAGDVSPREVDIRLGHLHVSCGAGARYDTPVGPIRLDVGYRIQPLQVLPYRTATDAFDADPTEGAQPRIFDVPAAVAFGIGEAF